MPQAGVNEGELEPLAALAKDNALQVRFIEMMPIGYGAAMPCISGPELRARFARRWPELAPLSTAQEHALGDGPAVYYTVPGWKGDIGFIAAVHGKFCASCNRVRLTSQGFFAPLPCQRDRVRPAHPAAQRRRRCAAAGRYPGDHLGKTPGTPF